ncbi:MAG: non-homologous end-joining DNA ligase [Actinomycetota bacterium]|nr:non-homologous end-joining DNA ligase [Actinomycetota bacterium]
MAADRLQRYREMRDFEATPEPSGAEQIPAPDVPRFVIQEHHATSLHWDLRLERDGVLASWAVPRGLPPDPRQNHLAVHTEDHPLMYLDFSGEIPAGQYGAGSMTIWDTGTYETEKWSDREVMVVLHGERARGRYVLFQTKGNQWMIHRMDPPEDPAREPMPEGLRPMLATLSDRLPNDQAAYGFEVKWDGIRALAYVSGGRVRLEARSGRDVSHRYPELRELGRRMGTTQAVVDGEIVALDANGRPSFERLQRRMHVESESAIRRLRQDVPVAYAIFDLLWLEGHSTTGLPYEERRRLLDEIGLNGPNWQTPPYHRGEGSTLLEATKAGGLEGVVAKRLDSLYEPGVRTRNWLKVKNHCSQDFVIGGWLPGEGARARLGALLVGYYEPGDRGVPEQEPRLVYAGKVGTGFTDAELTRLLRLLEDRRQPECPFSPRPPLKQARWVRPDLVVDVEFTEWTAAGILRHPSYKGMRDDREPEEVVRET